MSLPEALLTQITAAILRSDTDVILVQSVLSAFTSWHHALEVFLVFPDSTRQVAMGRDDLPDAHRVFPLDADPDSPALWVCGPLPDPELISSLIAHAGPALARAGRAEATRRRAARLDAALDGSGEGTWEWHVPSGRTYFDRRWRQMLGYLPGEIESDVSAWETLLHPDDRAEVQALLADVLAGRAERYQTEHRLKTTDGSWRWVLDTGKVLERDAGGAPVLMAGTHRDLSDITALRAAYSRSAQLLSAQRATFAFGPVVVFHWQHAEDWPVEWVSPSVEAVLGYPPSAFTAEALRYASVVHPEDLPRVSAEVQGALASGAEHFAHEDYRVLRPDGSVVWVHDSTVILRNRAGEVTHFVGYLVDVTGRVQAAAAHADLERRLLSEQRIDSLSVLAGGMAHDFNNLLVGILGNADLAAHLAPTGGEMAEILGDIQYAARRAADLVQSLLSFTGRAEMPMQPLNWEGLIAETVRAFSRVSPLIRVQVEEGLPVPEFLGSALHLRQALLHLLNNGADALPVGRGELRLRTGTWEPQTPPSGRPFGALPRLQGAAFVQICDRGTGITPQVLERMFDPFFSTKGPGRGLGLSAVFGTVRAHRGGIWVASAPEGGTEVTLIFPTAAAGPEPSNSAALTGKRVLLVDDEDLVRSVASRMLMRLGASVCTAEDGVAALTRFRADPAAYDLVFMDLTMPRLDGLSAAREILAINPSIRILLSSGYTEAEVADEATRLGLSGFVQKPYTLERIRDAALRALLALPARTR